jgi:hypothetical protein
MTATTISHSAPTARGDELHALAVQLYGLLSSGHDALAWNVDPRGPALTAIGADGKRWPVQAGGGGTGASAPPWQRARELREGVEVDRRFNPWVLERHLRGKYSVAPAAPAGAVGRARHRCAPHPRRARARGAPAGEGARGSRARRCVARAPLLGRAPPAGAAIAGRGLSRVVPVDARAELVEPRAHVAGAGGARVVRAPPRGRGARAGAGRAGGLPVGPVPARAVRSRDAGAPGDAAGRSGRLGLVPWPDTMATSVD